LTAKLSTPYLEIEEHFDDGHGHLDLAAMEFSWGRG